MSDKIEDLARVVIKRGLAAPAVFLLELYKPLTMLGSSCVTCFAPLINMLWGHQLATQLAEFLQSRENIEALICKIEQLHKQQSTDIK